MNEYTWEEEMICNVSAICKEGVRQWAALIDALGVPTSIRAEWCATYLKEMRQLMTEMYNDLEERQKNMTKVITELRNKIGESSYHLGVTVELDLDTNLYQQEAKLKAIESDLNDKIRTKESNVAALLERQSKICAILGRPMRILQDKPLPSNEEIDSFVLYVESLEDECFLREEKFTRIQYELQKIAEEIDYQPVGEFEEQILNQADLVFAVHDKNMMALSKFEQSLKSHANNIRNEVGGFMEHIKHLWETLDTDKKYCDAFQNTHKGLKKMNINALKGEIHRLEDLKRANLHMLIKRLREQLVVQWDLCHFSEPQRAQFDIFNDDIYTESMLTLFQNEVTKVSKHYADNHVLYESLAKFETTWKRVDELETPEQGQNRFKNRGGKLLIEEKERKVAKKRLEKLQQSISKLVDEYFANTGEEFTYDGHTVEEYFQSFEAKDELRLANSKSALGLSKSSNQLPSSRSVQKCPPARPSPSVSPTNKPRATAKSSNDSTSPKSLKASLSSKPQDKSQSVPVKRYHTIVSGADKLKHAAVAKLKGRSKLIRQLHQENVLDEIANLHDYKYFQKIADTSMPNLLNNTIDVQGNNTKMSNMYVDESPLAYPLSTQSTSRFETEHEENISPDTPTSSFHNITMRPKYKSNSKPPNS